MNKMKSELKILWTNNWGNRFDDLKERSDREVAEAKGAQKALRDAMGNLRGLFEFIKEDVRMVQDGEKPKDAKRPFPNDIEAAEYAQAYITRAIKMLENATLREAKIELKASGRSDLAASLVALAKKDLDEEQQRVEAFDKALAEANGDVERIIDPGRKEALSAAADIEQRRAEAKQRKAAGEAKAEATEQPPEPVQEEEKAEAAADSSTEVADEKPAKKTTKKKAPRRRKAKTTNGVNKGADAANAG